MFLSCSLLSIHNISTFKEYNLKIIFEDAGLGFKSCELSPEPHLSSPKNGDGDARFPRWLRGQTGMASMELDTQSMPILCPSKLPPLSETNKQTNKNKTKKIGLDSDLEQAPLPLPDSVFPSAKWAQVG